MLRSSFIVPRSSLILYVVATIALFAPFFWVCPFSVVSVLTLALVAVIYSQARRDLGRGLLLLTFLTPLVGSLPHLAPVRCPPPLLLIVAGFALGRLAGARSAASENQAETGVRGAGRNVALWLFWLFAVSGLLTAWRYLNHAPFGAWPSLEATVNVRQETVSEALGAAWQTMVVMLSGPLVFLLAADGAPRDERWTGRWVRTLLCGMMLAGLCGVLQMLFFPQLGNDPYWIKHHRVNATFTDPNGLGAFVALMFPLAAAMAVASGKRSDKALAVAVVLPSLVLLAGSGSRTGAVGLLVAALMFPVILSLRFQAEGEAFRQRVVFATLAALIAVIAFVPLESRWEGRRSVLFDRLAQTREVIARQGWLAPLVRDRWPLWKPTIHVALRYPVGGIGLGAFRYEMENIARLDGFQWRWLDNANNTYLQMAGELGLVGLGMVLVGFATLGRAIVRVIRSPGLDGERRWIYPALATVWFSFVVLLLTAVWLLFEQIQVIFWLFAAMLAGHADFFGPAGSGRRRRFSALALAALGVVGVSQAIQGFGDLSPARRRVALGLERSEGLYPWETDETGRRFRWTGEEACLTVPTARGEIRIETLARNPDLASRPLGVWISLDGKPVTRCEIASSGWRWIRVSVPPGTPNPAELRFRVERTWSPKDFGSPRDNRSLGIAVGRVENAAPTEPLPP